MRKFEINNDLDRVTFNLHNMAHFVGAYLLALVFGGSFSYLLWLVWEIGDGLKPWYYLYFYEYDKPKIWNWFRKNFFYSDKFSLQDVFIWNLGGVMLGSFVKWLIELIC